jgi:hypothetical protein
MRLSQSFLKKTVLNKGYRLERLMDDEDYGNLVLVLQAALRPTA